MMDVNRLGTLYPYPLSFMRCLVRRIMSEQWQITRTVFDVDENGFGETVYEIRTPNALFSYVVFSKYLPTEACTDRVIAEDWQMTVALCAGPISSKRMQVLRANVPLQENGRIDANCLVLSRANKSVRNFDAVVNALAGGAQPDLDAMAKVGYLYRTTAVYGSGKFGMADWDKIKCCYPDFAKPFAAEMFSCFMIRHFSFEQADHVAKCKSPNTAVKMADDIKRYVGIGNATGLGMAPYLINHPGLVSNWIKIREIALARIINETELTPGNRDKFLGLARKASIHLAEIETDNIEQNLINTHAREDLDAFVRWAVSSKENCWQDYIDYAVANLRTGSQELINVLILETCPEKILDLEGEIKLSEQYDLDPSMPLDELKTLIETVYDWALGYDFNTEKAKATFWYRSEEKMEPRLGKRFEDPGADKEMLLGIARKVRECYDDINVCIENGDTELSTARFAFAHPQHRYIIRRMHTMAKTTYGEIRANFLDEDVMPIHLLRCKLSFFGVGKFDPKSRLWVRNTMFQGAPLISDIGTPFNDDWCFPVKPQI